MKTCKLKQKVQISIPYISQNEIRFTDKRLVKINNDLDLLIVLDD